MLVETVDAIIPGLVAMDDSALIDVSDFPDIASSFTAPLISIAVLFWALLGGIANVRMSIRSIACTRHERSNAFVTRALDLVLALSIGFLIVVSAAVTLLGSTFVDRVLAWFETAKGGGAEALTRLGAVVVTFTLDTVIIAWLYWLLSGTKTRVALIFPGALLGGIGLVVLQQASGLFLGGVDNNPLLATFTSLIALLLWFNFSAQITLIACAYIMTTVEDECAGPDVSFAETLKQRAVHVAERDLRIAQDALHAATEAERAEHGCGSARPSGLPKR